LSNKEEKYNSKKNGKTKKKLGCEVGFVMVRSRDYGCGAVG
jgi:hypothetical protein